MRSLRRLACVGSMLAAACVPPIPEPSTPDAADTNFPASDASPMSPDSIDADPRTVCLVRGTPGSSHNHPFPPFGTRSGLGCINAGCHTGDGIAPRFTFAGTVYKSASGNAVNPGAVVRLFKLDPNGRYRFIERATANEAGNFYMGTDATEYPYVANVTACGSDAQANGTRSMTATISAGDGNCNKGGCHSSGQRIYLAD